MMLLVSMATSSPEPSDSLATDKLSLSSSLSEPLLFFFGFDFVEEEDDFFFGGGERREDDFLTGALFRFFDFGLSESSESTSENSSEISLSTSSSSESSSIKSSSSSESSCLRERPLPGNFDFETGFDLWLLLDEDLDLAASGFFAGAAGLVEQVN